MAGMVRTSFNRRVLRVGVAAVCVLALGGVVGNFGFPSTAHAVVGGITVPPGGTFADNNPNGTFTYAYSTISVVHEPGDETTETPTCTANNGATSGDGFISGGTFKQGTTTVTCTAVEDPADDNVSDTTSFTVTVSEPRPVFDNAPLSQIKTGDATDTATFTFATPVTAHEPGELSEAVSVSCVTDEFIQTPITSPVTLHLPDPAHPDGIHKYFCTATDTDNSLFARAFFTLRVLDEHTVLSNPGNQTATADATDTAVVSYPTVTPTESSGDSDGNFAACRAAGATSITSNTSLASSGTFNVGVTYVTCDANIDRKDGTNPPGITAAEITFTVTVTDQPVTLTVPPNQVAPATSPAGATVTYTPGPVTAVEDGEAETIPIPSTCTAPGATSGDGFVSGGNFPIGDTTVSCTAADPDGLSAVPNSFTVHVKGAAEQLQDLLAYVNGKGPGKSLTSKVQNAIDYDQAGDIPNACSRLDSLINEARAQSGKHLTTAQANTVITTAQRIESVLGC
jgi:hypothetical protein